MWCRRFSSLVVTMGEWLTTVLEVVGAAALIAGCVILFGWGVALLVAGVLAIAAGYLLG
jgi:hypothetical protein